MKIQLSLDEQCALETAINHADNPVNYGGRDHLSELWDVAFCHLMHETLTHLAYMNMLDISWVTDGMGKLRNYRINNAGRYALWLHNREKEKEAV